MKSSPTKTLYLIRHARSAPNPQLENHLWPLSPEGILQAEGLVSFLEPLGIGALYSSPFLRARQTVEPFANTKGLSIANVDALHERELTRSFTDDFEATVRRAWSDFDFALPGCETSREAQRRMLRAIEQIFSSMVSDSAAAASHGNAIGLFLNHLDPAFGFEQWRNMRMPDIFAIRCTSERLSWDRSFRFA